MIKQELIKEMIKIKTWSWKQEVNMKANWRKFFTFLKFFTFYVRKCRDRRLCDSLTVTVRDWFAIGVSIYRPIGPIYIFSVMLRHRPIFYRWSLFDIWSSVSFSCSFLRCRPTPLWDVGLRHCDVMASFWPPRSELKLNEPISTSQVLHRRCYSSGIRKPPIQATL